MGSVTSKSCLSQSDLSYLLQNTGYDQATVQAWYQVFTKTCKSETMTIQQFVHLFKTVFRYKIGYQCCELVFKTFNTSKSGFMTFVEFLVAVHVMNKGSPEEKLRWTFKLYDVNEDGLLTLDEVIQVFQTIFTLRSTARNKATELFNRISIDGREALTEDQFVENCTKYGNIELRNL